MTEKRDKDCLTLGHARTIAERTFPSHATSIIAAATCQATTGIASIYPTAQTHAQTSTKTGTIEIDAAAATRQPILWLPAAGALGERADLVLAVQLGLGASILTALQAVTMFSNLLVRRRTAEPIDAVRHRPRFDSLGGADVLDG